jgi:hypothetical protein
MSNTSTSQNMGLYVWNQATDVFKYDQLASNFTAIDQHDHSSGKGTKISKNGLADSVAAAIPTYETSLPSSPVDGQEIYYAADATNGVIWHLRYRSASSSSYKWEFVGGSPTRTFTNSTGNGNVNWTFSNVVQPNIPLAGDYNFELFVTFKTTTSSTGNVGMFGALTWPTKLTQAISSTDATTAYINNSNAVISTSTFALIGSEIVQITNNNSGTLTIVRAQQGTSAGSSYATNTPIYIIPATGGAVESAGVAAVSYSASASGETYGGGTRLYKFTDLEASSTQVPRFAFRQTSNADVGSYYGLSVTARPIRVG